MATKSLPFFNHVEISFHISFVGNMQRGACLIGVTHKGFWFSSRPPDVEHHHPFLVFDSLDRLHFHLTIYGKEAVARLNHSSAQTYLHTILSWFTYLEEDEWQIQAGRRWDGEPDGVRLAVKDYLVQLLRCKVREHRLGFHLVAITSGTKSTVRVFLASMKLFYSVMIQRGYYLFSNPLQDRLSALLINLEDDLTTQDGLPQMPERSGVVPPRPKHKQRLSDSYFKLEKEDWVPQIIDDPTLPALILAGGERLKYWGDRERCVTRILFESGGRVSEVVGLTLGDWVARGMLQEANAFSKGSYGRRIKFLRFSNETAKLLRRYFDGERRVLDPRHTSLDEYLTLAHNKEVDLQTIPLFLSRQRTPLSAKTYREHAWNPACRAAGIEADIHQSRHWHVTMAFREIYRHGFQNDAVVQQRLRELIEYMKWKSGWEMVEVYQHYFKAIQYADTQDGVHARLDEVLNQQLAKREQEKQAKNLSKEKQTKGMRPPEERPETLSEDPDFAFLRSLGGDGN
jgi:integrase